MHVKGRVQAQTFCKALFGDVAQRRQSIHVEFPVHHQPCSDAPVKQDLSAHLVPSVCAVLHVSFAVNHGYKPAFVCDQTVEAEHGGAIQPVEVRVV